MNLLLFLFFLLLVIVLMNRKFCRTIKGKKRCTKIIPQMNARDIITKQMKELKKNNNKNSGIRTAFKYASKQNKMNTGPYSKFEKMVQNETYKHLLNFKKWKFVPKTRRNIGDEVYIQDVEVLSSYDNKKYIYTFTLSRQMSTLFWRTDSVILKTMEGFENKNKNILGGQLKICGTEPMTGWHREGYCTTDENDRGTHTVCSEVDDDFLDYTKSMGNDLSSPRDGFPGLKSGDRWCLCANRWLESHNAGHAPKVILESTHKKTKDYVNLNILQKYN